MLAVAVGDVKGRLSSKNQLQDKDLRLLNIRIYIFRNEVMALYGVVMR